jgi:hypothetical protein
MVASGLNGQLDAAIQAAARRWLRPGPPARALKARLAQATSITVMAMALVGCGTLDVASRHTGAPPKCEVHGVAMTPELIRMSSGESVYVNGYWKPSQTEFPHHGIWLYQGERPYGRFSGRVRDFVCPECTAAFQKYWRQRQ